MPSPSPCACSPPRLANVAGVASVIDGDTIEVHSQRIRLHGIDAQIEAAMRADAPRVYVL